MVWKQALVAGLVAIGIMVDVYGVVALIVTAGFINLRIVGSSVSMSATYLGTIEHGAQGS